MEKPHAVALVVYGRMDFLRAHEGYVLFKAELVAQQPQGFEVVNGLYKLLVNVVEKVLGDVPAKAVRYFAGNFKPMAEYFGFIDAIATAIATPTAFPITVTNRIPVARASAMATTIAISIAIATPVATAIAIAITIAITTAMATTIAISRQQNQIQVKEGLRPRKSI